jgi:hypothetical protein
MDLFLSGLGPGVGCCGHDFGLSFVEHVCVCVYTYICVCVCVCVCVYIYICTYLDSVTAWQKTERGFLEDRLFARL